MQTKSLFTKVLLILIAISFLGWGVDGFVNARSSNFTVASVAGEDIMVADFTKRAQNLANRFAQMTGQPPQMSPQLMQAALFGIMAEKRETALASSLKLHPGNDVLKQEIAKIPVFLNENGQFDKLRFEMFLQQEGTTEVEFLDRLRTQVAMTDYNSAVEAALAPDTKIIDILNNSAKVERRYDIRTVSITPVTETPSAEALQQYYSSVQNNYLTDLKRTISLLHLTPDLIDVAPITDEAIKAYYDDNIDQFGTPKSLKITQLLFGNEAEAIEAAKGLTLKSDFKAIAKKYKSATYSTLGTVNANTILPKLSEAVMEIETDTVTQPIASDFGFHILKVTNIKPAVVTSLADATADIRQTLTKNQQMTALFDQAGVIEDQVLGGASLSQAATILEKAKVETIDLTDNEALTTSPRKAFLNENLELLKAAFTLPVGEPSSLIDIKDGSVALILVQSETPKAPKALDTIKDELIKAWQADQGRTNALKAANDIRQQMKAGNADKAVLTDWLKPDAFDKLTPTVAANTWQAMQNMSDNDILVQPFEDVFHVIKRAGLRLSEGDDAAPQTMDTFKASLLNEFQTIQAQALEAKYPADINQQVLGAILQQGQTQ